MSSADSNASQSPIVGDALRANAMIGASLDSAMWPDFLVGQPDKPVRVLLVDDDAHIRMVIAQEIMSDPRTIVVGQAGSIKEGRKAMRQHEFDVLLLDLNLGDGEGYELLDVLKATRPQAEAIMVTVVENDEKVMRAFERAPAAICSKIPGLATTPRRCCRWPMAALLSRPASRAACCSASTVLFLLPTGKSRQLKKINCSADCPPVSKRYCVWWPAVTPARRSESGWRSVA